MKYLADTHIFLWWLGDDAKLSSGARKILTDPRNSIYISPASIWEISIKMQLGKLRFDGDPVGEIEANGFFELPITARHAHTAGMLPRYHDDPFDRMLIAQARVENLALMSSDAAVRSYDIQVIST